MRTLSHFGTNAFISHSPLLCQIGGILTIGPLCPISIRAKDYKVCMYKKHTSKPGRLQGDATATEPWPKELSNHWYQTHITGKMCMNAKFFDHMN